MVASKQKIILMIEDDLEQQKMYGFIFKKAGFKFLSAVNGINGLEVAKKKQPNLILLDLLMYGIGGIETLKRLKKDKGTANIPVVIFTNYTKEEMLTSATELGAKAVIIKTDVTPAELVTILSDKYL